MVLSIWVGAYTWEPSRLHSRSSSDSKQIKMAQEIRASHGMTKLYKTKEESPLDVYRIQMQLSYYSESQVFQCRAEKSFTKGNKNHQNL